jgi:hypothetical protein
LGFGDAMNRSSKNFRKVWIRDEGICRYCGEEANSIDHIIPWAFKPSNAMSNLVAACMTCNLIAKDMVFPGFIEKRDFILSIRRKRLLKLQGLSDSICGPECDAPKWCSLHNVCFRDSNRFLDAPRLGDSGGYGT